MRALPAAFATSVLLPLLATAATIAPAAAGPPASGEFRVNTTTTDSQFDPSVATDADGDSVVVWSSDGQDGGGYGVYSQRYDAAGVAQGAEIRVNATTAGNQNGPSVAMDADGDYVVTWMSDGQDGSGLGVYARRFPSRGSPSAEVRINTTTTNSQSSPEVAMDAVGNYVITWESSGQDGSGVGVYARRYTAAGTALGGETRVNTTTVDDQESSDVARDADGNYVITWESNNQDGDWEGVYAQRYSAAGSPLGTETRINTTTASAQYSPHVAMSARGEYVIAWNGPDSDVYGVYAQRFNAAGTPQGSETRLNTNTTGSQYVMDAAMDADGDYLVTWDSLIQDGSGIGTYFRRFSSTGAGQGAETRANNTVANDQRLSSVALDADGDALLAWTSYDQDGVGAGIYARRFRGPDAVDLRLDQVDSADPAPALGQVTFRARVSNLEEPTSDTGIPAIDDAIGAASGVSVVSTIPDGATYLSSVGAGWTCTPATTNVKCRLTSPLAAGDVTARLSVTYQTPEEAGTLLHPMRVYENQLDPVSANNGETEATEVECTVQFSQAGFPTVESGMLSIEVDRFGSDCGESTVGVETAAGTATPGADYGDTGWVLVFDPTDATKAFEIPIVADALDEPNEQFRVRLDNPTGVLLGRQSVEVSTIFDNDAPPRINFSTTTGSGAEPGALIDATLRLSQVSGQLVTVTLARSGTATDGRDYFAPTKITIPPGQRTAEFTIEVADDAAIEGTETAILTLSNPIATALGSLKTFSVTITSDE